MINEVLSGIKVVKLYAWEIPMEEHIESIRNKELHYIKKIALVSNIIDAFTTSSPFFVSILSSKNTNVIGCLVLIHYLRPYQL